MASRRLTLALALLALAAAGAGCGGDDESTITSGLSGAGSSSDLSADADAKAVARTAQVALETYSTDNNGGYAGADIPTLAEIEPSLAGADLTLSALSTTYTIDVASESGATFSIARQGGGSVGFTCEPPGTGGCPDNGDWG